MIDVLSILSVLTQNRPIFHNEADFQHALAWEIHDRNPNAKVRLEYRPQGIEGKMYVDIWVEIEGRKTAIELKYKTRRIEITVDEEEFFLSEHGAQDCGRYDVIKDIQRIEHLLHKGKADYGYTIFLTNDSSYWSAEGKNRETADKDFRLTEDRILHGELKWNETTSPGTMKGREERISIIGYYPIAWRPYSRVGESSRHDFRFMMIDVSAKSEGQQSTPHDRENVIDYLNNFGSWDKSTSIKMNSSEHLIPISENQCELKDLNFSDLLSELSLRKPVFRSQYDLRDSLADQLRLQGYNVSVNHDLGNDKIDIWAESVQSSIVIAIEVRYKTAAATFNVTGESFELKKHAAYDISRYDFVHDVAKLERIVKCYPGVVGYALLISNDQLYWLGSSRKGNVDADFHLDDGRVLKGNLSWSKGAGAGTVDGREELICIRGQHLLNWQDYARLGNEKNATFKRLLVRVEK